MMTSRTREIAAVFILLLAVLCAGFLFTMIARSGFWLLLSFGLLGVIVFLQSFPWMVLVAFVALDVGMAYILHRSFTGRLRSIPVLASVLAVLTLGSGFLLSQTPLYGTWQPPAPHYGSLGDPFLRGYGAWRFHNLFTGTVSDIQETSYDILGSDGQTYVVTITPNTQFPEGKDIAVGDDILVVGEVRRDAIRAFGIRPITPREARALTPETPGI